PGDGNTVTVTVTAADGETVVPFEIVVTVLDSGLSSDASLESVTVGGVDAIGGAVSLPYGTRSAVVSVVTTDPYASYVVSGNDALEPGDGNTVTVTVTAADGETTVDYVVTVTVLEVVLGTDTGVHFITVAGQDGLAGSISVGYGTRSVSVVVETTDSFATFSVEGNVDLQPGENTVTVTVLAADGETSAEYLVKVLIPELSDDASFSLFKVNGLEVGDGDSIDLASGTSHVNVKFSTTNEYATYMISGDGKKAGEPLHEGANSLFITVTAQNGDSTGYSVTLNVLALGTNTDLADEDPITVNGVAIDTEILNQENSYLDLPLTATRVSVGVKTADSGADVFVNDKTVWPTIARSFSVEKGVNLFSVEVVPPAGSGFAKTYTFKIYVGGSDATLKSVKVNTTAITFNGEQVGTLAGQLANGTTKATLTIDPTVALKTGNNPGTTLEFDGGEATVTSSNTAGIYNIDGLVSGENSISITVNPSDPNAEPFTYTVVINVALSSDKSLTAFRLNGKAVTVGSKVLLPLGTEAAELDAVTHSPLATFEVTGADSLVPGLNTATITVTAEDESTQSYVVTLIVPKAVDTIVVPFPKAGVIAVDAKTNKAGNKVISAEIKKIGKGTVVKVDITNNFLIAKDKPTAGPARSVAIQKFLQTQKINGIKTAVYTFPAGSKKQKGTTVTIYYY
ncbi:MAG: cadherin-like beta sandwich domain-containing protein, partial [Actinomycetes bacterium]